MHYLLGYFSEDLLQYIEGLNCYFLLRVMMDTIHIELSVQSQSQEAAARSRSQLRHSAYQPMIKISPSTSRFQP